MITADPEVTCHEITEEDEFFVLACDGDPAFSLHAFIIYFLTVLYDCRYLGLFLFTRDS